MLLESILFSGYCNRTKEDNDNNDINKENKTFQMLPGFEGVTEEQSLMKLAVAGKQMSLACCLLCCITNRI